MEIEYLSSEKCAILVVEGHVDLEQARPVFLDEGSGKFPPPRHGWMCDAKVPDGEDAEWWREECPEDAKGAKPVTLSILYE